MTASPLPAPSIRRLCLPLCVLSALSTLAATATHVRSADYPARPVRLVVAAAPGGSADALARTLQHGMNDTFGQPVVIDNRAGASGTIGMELVARSAADGHTLLLITSTHTTLPSLIAKLPFDLVRDFAHVSLVVSQPNFLVVHPSVPVQTAKELAALARTKPDSLRFASGGNGTSPHLAGEMFRLAAGARITHIPYKGSGPGITDLVGGHVHMMFAGPLALEQLIRGGRLRLLAVADARRSKMFPDAPTLTEAGFPGIDSGTWYGLSLRAGTPAAVTAALYRLVQQATREPATATRLAALGVDVVLSPPAQFGPFVREEIVRWAAVIRAAGVRSD